MISVRADQVHVEDADTVKLRLETPLVIDTQDRVAWPKGDRDRKTERDRYEVRETIWLRFVDLDAHESGTEAGGDETADFEAWLETAENEWNKDEYELEVYSPGAPEFEVGSYDRILGGLARMSDGDKWETSLMTVHGNAVAWRDQSPL